MQKKLSIAVIFGVMLLLVAVFAVLKAYEIIAASWVWIFSPLWIPVAESFLYLFIKHWFEKE